MTDAQHTRHGVCNNIDGQVTSSENFGSDEERISLWNFTRSIWKCFIVSKNSFEFTEGERG